MPNNNSFDEERFVAVLEEAISKVKTEEDPVVLTDMKKLFKKHMLAFPAPSPAPGPWWGVSPWYVTK